MAKTVELLLTDTVESLGIVGDVVSVKTGYARNFLLPRGLAVKPTDRARQALAERRAKVQLEHEALARELALTVEKMQDYEITIQRSCNDHGWLYGSVTQHDIALLLQEAGFTRVTERHVRIGIAIKRVDTYEIPIQVSSELRAEVKLWVVPDRELDLERNEMEFDNEGNLVDKSAKQARARDRRAEAAGQDSNRDEEADGDRAESSSSPSRATAGSSG